MGEDINIGIISEALNNKVDLNQLNTNTQGLSYGSIWGMPSDKFVDMTLGASGTQYIAPANGYVFCGKKLTGNGGYVYIGNVTKGYALQSTAYYNGQVARGFLPVCKNDTFLVSYDSNTGGAIERFKFIYAEGEK